VIKFVSDLRQFFSGPSGSSTNKTYRHDITEILLKVALNTIKQTNKTKGVIRICKSKKDKQHNDQKKKDKQRPTKYYTEN
jgi:hypothetical protein